VKKCEGLPVADFDTGSSESWPELFDSVKIFHTHSKCLFLAKCMLTLAFVCVVWDSDMPAVQDPYLRCTWDNMVMLSPIVKQSLRPVFNQSFYFPVRAAQLQDSAYSRPAYDMFLSAATLSSKTVQDF